VNGRSLGVRASFSILQWQIRPHYMGAHIGTPIQKGGMKTTIEISDPLLLEARKVAASQGVTLRELVERGLRRVVSEAKCATTFKLRQASFNGNGLRANEASWDKLRDLAYEGRGG
jgi:hypothetical protein